MAELYDNTELYDLFDYDQLISEYGDQFTAEEAQYAVDHLE